MSFQFFIDKIAMPLLVAAAILAVTQVRSSFVSTTDFYEYKVESTREVTGLHVKLDYLLKSSSSMETKLDKMLKVNRVCRE